MNYMDFKKSTLCLLSLSLIFSPSLHGANQTKKKSRTAELVAGIGAGVLLSLYLYYKTFKKDVSQLKNDLTLPELRDKFKRLLGNPFAFFAGPSSSVNENENPNDVFYGKNVMALSIRAALPDMSLDVIDIVGDYSRQFGSYEDYAVLLGFT